MRRVEGLLKRAAQACVLLLLSLLFGGCDPAGPEPGPAANASPFFPLAVGNSWTYRCSVEGDPQFEKTVRILATVREGETLFFRTELTVAGEPRPTVHYLFADAAGNLLRSPGPSRQGSELVIGPNPKAGDKAGRFLVAGFERVHAPAVGEREAVRLETFPLDDPKLPAERRAEWLGRHYVRGVGLVAEADGLGGESVLIRYRLAR